MFENYQLILSYLAEPSYIKKKRKNGPDRVAGPFLLITVGLHLPETSSNKHQSLQLHCNDPLTRVST